MDNFENSHNGTDKLLGVCTQCGKAIYAEADVGETAPAMRCKACMDKELAEKRRAEEAKKLEKIRTLEEAKRSAKKALIIPAVVIGILATIVCIFDPKDMLAIIPSSILLYLVVSQVLMGSEAVVSVLLFFLRAPKFTFGLIFDLSLEGCLWFLVVKLLLWLLGIILSVVCFLLGFAIATVCAVFTFPFQLYKAITKPEELDFFLV